MKRFSQWLNDLSQWLNDLRWARNMMRARRIRRSLGLAARRTFDTELAPRVGGAIIIYPYAFYIVETRDLVRATLYAKGPYYCPNCGTRIPVTPEITKDTVCGNCAQSMFLR